MVHLVGLIQCTDKEAKKKETLIVYFEIARIMRKTDSISPDETIYGGAKETPLNDIMIVSILYVL
jgi:hypothetical protein